MATLIRFNNAEGGTDGVAVTTGNSGGASGDAFNSVVGTGLTFSNLVVGAGSLSYRTANASVYALWNSLGGVTNWTLRARVYFANVTQTQGVVYARESNGDYTSLEYSGSSRFWRIRGTGGTASGTVQLTAATWYDVELSCANSTTNTARIYNTSGVLLDSITFGNTVTVALDEAWFGSFVATGIYPSYFDSFGVYNDKVDTLTANGLTSNSSVGNPTLTTSGGSSLTADPIVSASYVGSPNITQSQILTASGIVSNSYVSEGSSTGGSEMPIQMMNSYGGITATGSAGNANAYNNGKGLGWQKTIQTTNTLGIVGGVSDTILIPLQASHCSVTFAYNGAGTVTVDLQATNGTADEIVAGTATWGKFPTSVATQITGGSSNSTAQTVTLSSTPTAIRLLVGGSGATGSDTFTLSISAVGRLTI